MHIAVDTLGHLLALTVTPADQGDREQVAALAEEVQQVTGGTVELAFVDATDGISQADLNRKLGLNQSRLSKLLRKMIREGWLEQYRDHYDLRLQMLKSTSSGLQVLYHLESTLSIPAQEDSRWSNVPIADAPEAGEMIHSTAAP